LIDDIDVCDSLHDDIDVCDSLHDDIDVCDSLHDDIGVCYCNEEIEFITTLKKIINTKDVYDVLLLYYQRFTHVIGNSLMSNSQITIVIHS
jgi:capsule polysaccharide modification protein KpsS